MNIASARGANVLSKYRVSRVVLSRELSLEEIRNISLHTNVELEVFVHGALCVSFSGLCLFSSYLGGKSANRGLCTQACRRIYNAHGISGTESAYYFSPCDLSLIARIPELADAGVRSFKIEGRMKSAEYVGAVVSAYRLLIDNMESGEDARRRALEDARSILQKDFARPKTEYFINGAPDAVFIPEQDGGTGIKLGIIQKISGSGSERRGLIKNDGEQTLRLSIGDSVRFHKADDSRRDAHKLVYAGNADRNAYLISVPEGFERGDTVYLIQIKALARRYPPVLPNDLSKYKRQPGREKAPVVSFDNDKQADHKQTEKKQAGKKAKENKLILPEGIFVAAASVEDLYVIQSIRPAAVILPVNRKTIRALLDDKPLPFSPMEIILAFSPWFSQEDEAFLAELPALLQERGYNRYILNNPGHFSLFRGSNSRSTNTKPLLITGPWLYTFNSYAFAFTASLGGRFCITPLENNRQNLEKTIPPRQRNMLMVTLFAWPPLFRIKTGAGGLYKWKQFSGSREESFSLLNGDGSAVVIPNEPFCISDKRPFLMEAGFRRFILDFSAGLFDGSFPLKKKLYKEVMQAAQNAQPLARISRFNWKDGFFSEKTQKMPH
jgi:putative protease